MRARVHLPLLPALLLLAWLPASAAMEARNWALDESTTLVLVEDHRAPLVQVILEFPVGVWSPWARSNHAEEAFEIQLYDPQARLRARADELAADLTVDMGNRAATVNAACLREDLDEVLELIARLLGSREFDRKELKRWKQAGKLEWTSSRKIPRFLLAQAAARGLFAPGDPRRLPYEKPQPLSTSLGPLAATRDTVVRLPARVIGFAGAVDEPTARSLASGLLPDALETPPEGVRPELLPLIPAQARSPEETVTVARVNQTFFHYGRGSLTYDDPGYPAFLIADHVLGGHFHSRMYSALRHEGGETYSAYTVGEGGAEQQAYGLETFTRAENAETTEAKLRAVLEVFHEDGITEDERLSAVGFLEGRQLFTRQSPGQILRRHLWERRNGLPPGFRDELIDRAARVPLPEINAFIREFFDPAAFRMVRVQPD